MKINIESLHFSAKPELLEFITQKADKLAHHFVKIISADAVLKINNPQIDKNKVAEITLHIPGSTLFAKEQCSSFEEAVTLVIESLVRQLDKKKLKAA